MLNCVIGVEGGFVTSLYSPQCFCPWPALPVARVQLGRADGMSWPRVLLLSVIVGIFQGHDACVCQESWCGSSGVPACVRWS